MTDLSTAEQQRMTDHEEMRLSDREAIARKVEQALEGKEYSVVEMAYDLIRLARHPVWEEHDRMAGELKELTPGIAAVAATLVDLAKRSLPPHISEAQQVEAYLALRRIAGGQS
jgi:hypothetical protein